MARRAWWIACAGIAVIAALPLHDRAWAANGAYVVDSADISEVGSCKIESWLSTATNTDFSAVANPSCVVDIVKPVELSMQTIRFRSDGDLGTTLAPKAKWNIVPTAVGKLGVAFYAGGTLDPQRLKASPHSRWCPRPTGFPKPCASTSMPAGSGIARATGTI